MGFNEISLMSFGILLIFIVKKIVSMFNARKNLEGEIVTFELRGRKVLFILSMSLVLFGGFYAFKVRDIFNVVYMLIVISYSIISTDKLYIGENGFCYDGKFV